MTCKNGPPGSPNGPFGPFFFLRLTPIDTGWAELGITQAETVSLELMLDSTLFKLPTPKTPVRKISMASWSGETWEKVVFLKLVLDSPGQLGGYKLM